MNASVDGQPLLDFMTATAAQFEKIPPAWWIGLVGAGVLAWWVNRGQMLKLQLQLQAERDRLTETLDHHRARLDRELSEAASARALERIAAMRREVYFATASALAKAELRLVQVPLQDALPSGLTSEVVLELARVELIGDRECRHLAAKAVTAFTHAELAAATAHLPVETAEHELGKAEFDCRRSMQELESLHAQIRRVREESESGIVNPTGLSDLPGQSKRVEDLKGLTDSAHARRLAATEQLGQARAIARREIDAALQECKQVSAQLAAAMRRELGFVDREEDQFVRL